MENPQAPVEPSNNLAAILGLHPGASQDDIAAAVEDLTKEIAALRDAEAARVTKEIAGRLSAYNLDEEETAYFADMLRRNPAMGDRLLSKLGAKASEPTEPAAAPEPKVAEVEPSTSPEPAEPAKPANLEEPAEPAKPANPEEPPAPTHEPGTSAKESIEEIAKKISARTNEIRKREGIPFAEAYGRARKEIEKESAT